MDRWRCCQLRRRHPSSTSGAAERSPCRFRRICRKHQLAVGSLPFAAALTVVAGFLVLYEAMSRRDVVSVLERSGYAAAIATALIFAANMAVDGIALKRAVDAWAAASDADKRFVSLPPRQCAGWSGARTLSSKFCSD
jgi:hypothetical protein